MAIRGTREFGISREIFFVRRNLVTFSRKKRNCFAHLFFENICCSEFDADDFEPNFFLGKLAKKFYVRQELLLNIKNVCNISPLPGPVHAL